MKQLGELKSLLSESQKKGIQILAISPDSPEDAAKIEAKLSKYPGSLDFPILSDTGHRVIDRYGILNPQGPGIPHPAVYLVDRDGVVRWRFVEVDYKVRASNGMIQEAIGRLGGG